MAFEKKEKAPFTLASPMTRRLSRMAETEEGASLASYTGVLWKCLFFLGITFLGVALSLLLNTVGSFIAEDVPVTAAAVLGAVVSLICMIVFPFIASFFPRTSPVTGSIGCASIGFVLAFAAVAVEEYSGIVFMALLLTLGIVLSMAFVYFFAKIRITNRAYRVFTAILIAYLISGLLIGLCYFLPPFRAMYLLFATNPVIMILSGIFGVAIAAVMLMFDFESVRSTVENRLPKTCEWAAAYSLIFTVLWLYIEVLNLLRILNDKK